MMTASDTFISLCDLWRPLLCVLVCVRVQQEPRRRPRVLSGLEGERCTEVGVFQTGTDFLHLKEGLSSETFGGTLCKNITKLDEKKKKKRDGDLLEHNMAVRRAPSAGHIRNFTLTSHLWKLPTPTIYFVVSCYYKGLKLLNQLVWLLAIMWLYLYMQTLSKFNSYFLI